MFSKLRNWVSDQCIRWLNYEKPHEGVPICDFERIRYELRPCDVLLIEGRSRVSDIIRFITQSSWSHAALYLGRLHDIEDPKIREMVAQHFKGPIDAQLIVEGIMGKGAIISPLSVYEFDNIRVCRPRGLFRQDAQKVIAHAIKKLGNEYDVRQVVDLARFLLPWKLFPRRVLSKLFLEHETGNAKIVCSTLIAEAFSSVEFPILPLIKTHDTKGLELITRNTRLYSPRDFDYSPYFDIIKYPYIEVSDYAVYRKLPWNRDGLVSHDRLGIHTIKPKANPHSHPVTNGLDEDPIDAALDAMDPDPFDIYNVSYTEDHNSKALSENSESSENAENSKFSSEQDHHSSLNEEKSSEKTPHQS